MMQNSLDRLFEGLAASLRESVLPAVDDPYARSQVGAAIELIGNLGARVQWRTDQIDDLVTRIRAVLDDPPELTGDPEDDRRAHLEALAAACTGDVDDAVRDLLMDDLAAEFERLKTGMYR